MTFPTQHFMQTLTVALVIVVCGTVLHAQENSTTALDLLEPGNDALQVQFGPEVTRSRSVSPRLDVLDKVKPGDRVSMSLFPDVTFLGTVDRIERRSARRYSCFGRLDDDPRAAFVLVVEEDVVVGTIQAPSHSALYKIRYGGDGTHLICQVDENQFPPCGVGLAPQNPPINQLKQESPESTQENGFAPEPPPGPQTLGACNPLAPVFDVLIVYTELARQAAGGANAINAECQLAIDLGNQAYDNSQITARLRLVFRGEIEYDENGSYTQHLGRLAGGFDGFMDSVHVLRDTYRADLVSLLVTDTQFCGFASCNADENEAFSVVTRTCINNHSFVHELGHNQGCQHDRANANCSGAFSYSFGWPFIGQSGAAWRTIMAVPAAGGTRIQNFSNPNVSFDGAPTGVPIGQSNESHNAQTINNRATTVEAFRLTRFDVWVDFSVGGFLELGSFDFPYDTMSEGLAAIIGGVGASEIPTLWIKEGTTSETPTISQPMTIRACGGTVRIGA